MAHFPNIWGKKSFSKKTWLHHAQLHKGFYHHAKILRNLMIQFQKNTRTDGRTLFHRNRTLPATASGSTNTTTVDWQLKVKDKEYDVDLTKNHCITVSMQKISSIHKLIFKILQILGRNELNGHVQPKIIEIAFNFLECAPAWKKSVRSIYSFLRQSILKSRYQTSHIHFWLFPPKNV